MRETFRALADHVTSAARGSEVITCFFQGERSDFVRINGARIRQAGSVHQQVVTVRLIDGMRHASAEITLGGHFAADAPRVDEVLGSLRALLPHLPEDPHLRYATEVHNSDQESPDRLPAAEDAVDLILGCAGDADLVGLWASGGVHTGFANSLGQRNWHSGHSFNLEFSLYHLADKAVKSGYAGFAFDPQALSERIETARAELSVLRRPPRTIQPGHYRVFLAPAALRELVGLLAWDSLGLRSVRTRQSGLLKLALGDASLHPDVTLRENVAEGVAPGFSDAGFIKPASVALISGGQHAGTLVSPRSAAEYGVSTNGAGADECPNSLDMAAGTLPRNDAVRALGTGVWINNLWYNNFSDRSACRITGMTRFATFWVEEGEVVAPLNVMRFDETLYRMWGENLLGLTAERDLILDGDTYGRRSSASMRLPGALIADFAFTL